MNSNDYIKDILEKLLHKYNTRIAKSITTSRRVLIKPRDIFKGYADNNADMGKKEQLHYAIDELLDKGMITVDRLKYSTDVEKIYLCEDKVDNIYEYLSQKYGILPQRAIAEQLKEMLSNYVPCGPLVQNYCDTLLKQLEDPRATMLLPMVHANLKMLCFLENNNQNVFIREASMLVYGDSKWFEKNNYEEICNILRTTLDAPKEENEEILARYFVIPAEQEVFIKGDWTIEWKDHILETKYLQGGIAIASNDILDIEKITIHAKRVMTIENKTAYQRMSMRGTACLYLGGFATRYQVAFLKKVIEDNPKVSYWHFGDIDIGGFFIHRHLCKATEKEFKLFAMELEQLKDERFAHCLQPLTDNDRNRMETLLEDERYEKVLTYMREMDVKLEQEIVAYYL